jgi:transcriptional regulator with XRE-family HTH domain
MRAGPTTPILPNGPTAEARRHQRSQENLGKAIRVLRERGSVTQKQLAERSGLHPSWVSRVEAGMVDIRWGDLRRIASGLGVNVEELTSLTRDYEMTEAVGLAVRALRAEQELSPSIVAEIAGLTIQELDDIEAGHGPFVGRAIEGKLRRGLRIRKKRWFRALEEAKSSLGFA